MKLAPIIDAPTSVLEGGRLVEAVKRLLATPGALAVDTETNVVRQAHKRRAHVISMAHEQGSALVGWLDDRPGLILREAFADHLALPPWERPATLCAHNAQFEVEVLLTQGIPVDVECSLLAAKCLYLTAVAEDQPQPVEFSLAALVEREFGRRRDKTIRDRDWSRREALDEEGAEYALEDAQDALALWRLYRGRLREDGLWRGYRAVSRAILPTAQINMRGMAFDGEAHARLCTRLNGQVRDLSAELARHCGRAVRNHGSTPQVSNWIVEQVLGLDQLTPPVKPKLETLAQFVRRTGKLRADGETRARDFPASIADLMGRSHEDATLSAWEAGYLGPRGDDRPGPDVLLNALADDLNRHLPPVLREEDQGEQDVYVAELAAFEATQAALLERGLEQKRRLLAAFDTRLRAHTSHGWRWAQKTLNLKVDKGAMARKPAVLEPHWPRVAAYLTTRARWTKSRKLLDAFGPKLRDWLDEDGRVRGQLKIAGTVTMRHSCTCPNLQQQPLDPDFRALWIAPPGKLLIIADFSQIELRLLCVEAKDERLMAVYREGRDVHAETASVAYKVPLEQVTKEQRKAAKAINFGLAFGSGAAGLSENGGFSLEEAQVLMGRVLGAYPGLARYREEAPEEAARLGHIPIRPSRRVLYDPAVSKGTQAINFKIQGGAASVQMLALRKLHDALHGRPVDIVAAVHDEILLEASEELADEAAEVLVRCMSGALTEVFPETVEMGVHRLAEASRVTSWNQKS